MLILIMLTAHCQMFSKSDDCKRSGFMTIRSSIYLFAPKLYWFYPRLRCFSFWRLLIWVGSSSIWLLNMLRTSRFFSSEMLGGTPGNTEKTRASKNKDAHSFCLDFYLQLKSFVVCSLRGRHTNGWMDWWQEKKKVYWIIRVINGRMAVEGGVK